MLPPDRTSDLYAVASVFVVASSVAVALRIYVRHGKLKSMGKDDYTMIVAQLFFLVFCAFQFATAAYGTGKHLYMLTPENAETARKYWWLDGIFYALATTSAKVSVGFFLHRFTTHRYQDYVIRAVNTACIVFGSCYVLIELLQCFPISFWWDMSLTAKGKCISPHTFLAISYTAAALNALADLVFAVLPMVIVSGTTMNRRTRITVCCILALGSSTVLVTIVRTAYGWTARGVYDKESDFLWESTPIDVLSTVEVGVGITAASTATLRPLFQRWLGAPARPVQSIPGLQYADEWQNPTRKPKRGLWQTLGLQRATPERYLMSNRSGRSRRSENFKSTVTGRERFSQIPDLIIAGRDYEADVKEGYVIEEIDVKEYSKDEKEQVLTSCDAV